jgi:hypothetical protein
MKRKFAFALLFTTTIGGAWSCLTWGQDPIVPARVIRPSVTTTRNFTTVGDGGETVTIAGGDVVPGAGWTIAGGNINNNLDENVTRLVRELKSSEGADKESVLTKLKSAVGEQFDNRQEGKAKELKALEEQLAKLKEIHNKRTQQREQIVADRVQQLLREVEGLGWGSDSGDATGMLRFQGSRLPMLNSTLNRIQGAVASPAAQPANVYPAAK